ncbi:MAG TPA: HEAT repeat domain-containing protein [Nitrospiraceae bacterium]|nr:HEAT repeat domain-containing protein [Nitrospiraceae bacterium]
MLRVMRHHGQIGQANLTAIFLLLAIVIAGVWIWKRLTPDTQEVIVDQAIPLAGLVILSATALWVLARNIRAARDRRRLRRRLIDRLQNESVAEKRLELAFALIEANEYQRGGLEPVAPLLQQLFTTTLKTALGDKQHQRRGMAASHLGVIGDEAAVQTLLAALKDDHAYVRACAALGLGRLRATEAKDKLVEVSKDDWDQTVRSRAREALERIR